MITKDEFEQVKKFGTYDEYAKYFQGDLSPDGIKNTVGKLVNAPSGWETQTRKRGGSRMYALPRHLSMYAMMEFGGLGLSGSARQFGQDHCSAIYAKKCIENALKTKSDPQLKEMAMKVIGFYKNLISLNNG